MEKEKKNILVVDDEKIVLKVFKELLESKGYSVDTAETAREALDKSNSKYYSLALLDIKLPDMDGTELLIKMRKFKRKTVKIMITGLSTIEYATKSLRLGADAFIMKPVEPEELLEVIEKKLKES